MPSAASSRAGREHPIAIRYQLSAFSSQQHNSSVSSSVIHPSRFISSQPSFEPVFAENQERHENGRLLISR
jgi:hypothetical protein